MGLDVGLIAKDPISVYFDIVGLETSRLASFQGKDIGGWLSVFVLSYQSASFAKE
jgi:hypothetical protein